MIISKVDMLRMLEVRRFRSVVESLIENLLRFGSSVRCPLVCGSNVYMPKIIVVLLSRQSKISVLLVPPAVTYPDCQWPFAIVRLEKAYLLLENIHRALEQFEKVLRLLSPLQDEKFVRYVEGLLKTLHISLSSRVYVKVTKSLSYYIVLLLYTNQVPIPLGP